MTIHLTISRGEERSASSDTLPTLVSLSSRTRIWSEHFRLLILAACLRIFSASSLLPRTASHRVDSGTNLQIGTIHRSCVKRIRLFFTDTKIPFPLLLLSKQSVHRPPLKHCVNINSNWIFISFHEYWFRFMNSPDYVLFNLFSWLFDCSKSDLGKRHDLIKRNN